MMHEAPSMKKGKVQRKPDPLDMFPDERIYLYLSMCEYIYIYIHTHIYEYIYALNINFTQTRYKGKEN